MSVVIDPKFSQTETAVLAQSAMRRMDMGTAGAHMVNRTRRVVQARAHMIQEQRSRARSLMLPLAACSALLILTVLAVWTGLYQYQGAGAIEPDVTALAATEATNHSLVTLLWFAPVSVAVLAVVWVRRSRTSDDDLNKANKAGAPMSRV
jgi:hypothetical protein